MESGLVILDNILNGLFLTHCPMAFDEETNPRVPAYSEILILREFRNAEFVRLDDFVQRADTPSFYFFRYDEEIEDDITWIEVKGAGSLSQ
ncbi:MAG TPA: hypothetical protein VIH57_25965 [Bacteroidales bacterium]